MQIDRHRSGIPRGNCILFRCGKILVQRRHPHKVAPERIIRRAHIRDALMRNHIRFFAQVAFHLPLFIQRKPAGSPQLPEVVLPGIHLHNYTVGRQNAGEFIIACRRQDVQHSRERPIRKRQTAQVSHAPHSLAGMLRRTENRIPADINTRTAPRRMPLQQRVEVPAVAAAGVQQTMLPFWQQAVDRICHRQIASGRKHAPTRCKQLIIVAGINLRGQHVETSLAVDVHAVTVLASVVLTCTGQHSATYRANQRLQPVDCVMESLPLADGHHDSSIFHSHLWTKHAARWYTETY